MRDDQVRSLVNGAHDAADQARKRAENLFMTLQNEMLDRLTTLHKRINKLSNQIEDPQDWEPPNAFEVDEFLDKAFPWVNVSGCIGSSSQKCCKGEDKHGHFDDLDCLDPVKKPQKTAVDYDWLRKRPMMHDDELISMREIAQDVRQKTITDNPFEMVPVYDPDGCHIGFCRQQR